jgi:hypothetical protein
MLASDGGQFYQCKFLLSEAILWKIMYNGLRMRERRGAIKSIASPMRLG